MSNRFCSMLLIFILAFKAAPPAAAQRGEDGLADIIQAIRGISISGQWFLMYQRGDLDGEQFNEFGLKRGYITIKKRFSSLFAGRITPDISVDREGDGRGDLELRLKYCYLQYTLPDLPLLTHPYIEFGLVHRPWLDFEEHINNYRVQGTMYLERIGIMNSADYGLTLIALLGGTLDHADAGLYPGRYGSLALGIYNGGGYHAIEENAKKSFEGRLTIRPLPEFFPGLQFSYSWALGHGNTAAAPEWDFNALFLSAEHRRFVLTAMAFEGNGASSGTLLDASGRPVHQAGRSAFAEFYFVSRTLSLFGRIDHIRRGGGQRRRFIAGLSYHFLGQCKMLIDIDHEYSPGGDDIERTVAEFAVEVHY